MDLLLSHPRGRVNCKDMKGNTPLWLSTHLSCDAVTEKLLKEPHVDIKFIGENGEFQAPSTSLHHAVLKPNTAQMSCSDTSSVSDSTSNHESPESGYNSIPRNHGILFPSLALVLCWVGCAELWVCLSRLQKARPRSDVLVLDPSTH
jgi:hypothetical protein